ncbi:hypothetical protein NQS33_17370 [Bacillus sp. C5(2022)]|uniref:hypothetical protein n=1 Tax=Bacillus TaxID=1386 RepID=UPI0030CC28A8
MRVKYTMSANEIWAAIQAYMKGRGYTIESGRFKGGCIEPVRAELELNSKE